MLNKCYQTHVCAFFFSTFYTHLYVQRLPVPENVLLCNTALTFDWSRENELKKTTHSWVAVTVTQDESPGTTRHSESFIFSGGDHGGKMRLSSVSAVCISGNNHNMQHEKIIRLLLSYVLIIYQPATRCLDKTRLFESVPLTLRICRLPRTISYCYDVEPKCASSSLPG